jgi:ABC transporter
MGMSFVPADRPGLGSIQIQSVAANILLGSVGLLYSKGWLSARRECAEAAKWITSVALPPAEPHRILSTLSGGNQQKAVLARVLRQAPRVIVLDEAHPGRRRRGEGDDLRAARRCRSRRGGRHRQLVRHRRAGEHLRPRARDAPRSIATELRSGQMSTETIAEQCLR